MLLNILDLEKVTVDDVLVPHNEIVGIDLDEDIDAIAAVIRNSEHTRLPVYRDNIDQVIGLMHLRRVANIANEAPLDKKTIERLVVEPYFVPEGTPLSTQLVQFQKMKQRFALVVDEYGDIQGIVTLEDILEEIVGEFTTDPASNDDEIVRESESSFLIDGTANIRQINRVMNWSFPTEGPKTLNGLILETLELIPKPGTCLKIDEYPIEIVQSDNNRVQVARISARRQTQVSLEED
jgi:Mg2+/Co2+ transporter CorB